MTIWCLDNALAYVTQEYGANRNVIQSGGHTGMDFGVPPGTPIRAEADGVIVFACWADDLGWPNPYYIATSSILPSRTPGQRGGGGIVIGLDTGPYLFIHAHCARTDLNPGDRVKQGQIMGYTGATGYVFGAHLHLDVLPDRWNVHSPDGRYGRINPRSVIDGKVTTPPAPAPLKPNERLVGMSPVNQRKEPRLDSPIVRVIPPGTKETWTHFVHGEEVNWNGTRNDIWLGDGDGYASVLFFDPTTEAGLLDKTPPKPVPAPPPVVTLPVVPTLHGVDISNHQRGLDVATLPGDLVIFKASEGVGYTDPMLSTWAPLVSETKARLFYHFARPNATPDNTAAAEATYFLEVVRPHLRLGDVLVLDWESDDTADTAWAVKWLRIVAGATGSTPLLYTYVSKVNEHDWADVEDEFPLWLAGYTGGSKVIEGFHPEQAGTKIPVEWKAGFKMWQYTSSGRLPGWGGNLDLNVWYGTRADLQALGVKVIPPTPGQGGGSPAPVDRKPPTIDQPIQALIEYYK
jgi:GH25 family lysozyme M1 (1,4-beta-N-acetylmuramidase)